VNQLDATYNLQRRQLSDKLSASVGVLFTQTLDKGRDAFIPNAVNLVQGGMTAVASLVNAYFSQKVRIVAGEPLLKTVNIDPSEFTVEKLRGVPAEDVYARPYAALGFHLNQGEPFEVAAKAGADRAVRIAATDLQLAQTHAARAWIGAHNG